MATQAGWHDARVSVEEAKDRDEVLEVLDIGLDSSRGDWDAGYWRFLYQGVSSDTGYSRGALVEMMRLVEEHKAPPQETGTGQKGDPLNWEGEGEGEDE